MIMLVTLALTLSFIGVTAYWYYRVVDPRYADGSGEVWAVCGFWSLVVHLGMGLLGWAAYALYQYNALSPAVLGILGVVTGLVVTVVPIRRYERLRNSQ
jgi:hypothetical protein